MKVTHLDPFAALLDLIREAAREGVAQALATQVAGEPSGDLDALLNKRALAHALGVSTATVDRLCRTRRIPFVVVGDARRFDLAAVRAALATTPSSPSPKLAPPEEAAGLHGVKLLTRGGRR
jgi:excisionase family DNA binding protein